MWSRNYTVIMHSFAFFLTQNDILQSKKNTAINKVVNKREQNHSETEL